MYTLNLLSVAVLFASWYKPGRSASPKTLLRRTDLQLQDIDIAAADIDIDVPVEYVFSFGDSYTQTGFDINGAKPSPSNPFGNPPFPGFTSSGGQNWIDYLVTTYNTTTTVCYNFASGGATIDSAIIPPYIDTVKSLKDQVGIFKDNVEKTRPWKSEQALFVIWIGINDIGNSYYKDVDQDALHETLQTIYLNLLSTLHTLSARKFLLLSIPPIQKTPQMLSQPASARLLEAKQITSFNTRLLIGKTEKFKAANPDVKIWSYDTSSVFEKIIANPGNYGFQDAVSFCGDRKCMWWNDYHPSEGVHKVLAEDIVKTLGKSGVFFS